MTLNKTIAKVWNKEVLKLGYRKSWWDQNIVDGLTGFETYTIST